MAAADSELTFLFDENSPHRLVRALRELGEKAYHIYDIYSVRGTPDVVWLPRAAEEGWIPISYDHRILQHPHERAVLTDRGMGAFFIKPEVRGICDISRAIFRNWPEIKRIARNVPRPFTYQIGRTTVLPLRARHYRK